MQSRLFEEPAIQKPMHDVGGRVRIPLPPWVTEFGAVFRGEKRQYRTKLIRGWDNRLPTMLFVMMNPSVAKEDEDDPTVRKCWFKYARTWGFGRVWIGNTAAYRCTDQKRLLEVDDPIGPENDKHLLEMAAESSLILFAYGTPHKSLRQRGIDVARMFRAEGHNLHVLRLSKNGIPVHPLYLPEDLKPIPWEP
jgi:hypothetical protein